MTRLLKRVLLVCPDDVSLDSLPTTIAQLGYAAQRVEASSKRVLRVLERQGADVVLLVCDVLRALPICRSITAGAGSVPIYVLTEAGSAQDYKALQQAGAMDMLFHPWELETLRVALEHAFDTSNQGLAGSVHGVAAVDLLQMFHLARRTVRVFIGEDCVCFRNGEIIHAEARGITGKTALMQALGRESGSVRTEPLGDSPQTIDSPFQHLLLDTMCALDEAQRQAFFDDDDEPTLQLKGEELGTILAGLTPPPGVIEMAKIPASVKQASTDDVQEQEPVEIEARASLHVPDPDPDKPLPVVSWPWSRLMALMLAIGGLAALAAALGTGLI